MSHSNNVITAPVNIVGDIAAVLGVNSGSLNYLCGNAHGKINPWAKYKPVPMAAQFPDRSGQWWKGDAPRRCGITAPQYTTCAAAAKACNGGMAGWTYNPGGPPYRALDFNGYDHAALCPVHAFGCSANGTIVDGKMTLFGTLSINQTNAAHLTLADIGIETTLYVGVYMELGGTSRRATASVPVTAAGGDTCEFTLSNFYTTGAARLWPFLSTAKFGVSDPDPAATFYSVPNVQPRDIVISSYVSQHYVDITRVVVSRTSSTVTIRCVGLSGTTLSGSVLARLAGKSPTAALEFGEASTAIIIKPTSADWTTTVTVDVPSDVQAGGYLYLTLSSGQYTDRYDL